MPVVVRRMWRLECAVATRACTARSASFVPRIVREVIVATTGTPPAGAGSTTALHAAGVAVGDTSLPLLSLRRDFLLADLPHDPPSSVLSCRFRRFYRIDGLWFRQMARRCGCSHSTLVHQACGSGACACCCDRHWPSAGPPRAAGDRRVRELRVQSVPPAAPEPRHRRRHGLPLRVHPLAAARRAPCVPISRCIATRSSSTFGRPDPKAIEKGMTK